MSKSGKLQDLHDSTQGTCYMQWLLSSYFAISPEPHDQNSSLTPFWEANLNMHMLR